MDGLIVHSGALSYYCGIEEYDQYLETFGDIPLVNLSIRQKKGKSVLLDNYSSMKVLTEHLLKHHGYLSYLYIGGPLENPEAFERLSGFESVMLEGGIPKHQYQTLVGDLSRNSGYSLVKDSLSGHCKLPDAIVCANDEVAFGAYKVLEELALKVPEDIAVVGFDDVESAALVSPPLTTVKQPFSEMVSHAYDLLVNEKKDDYTALGQLSIRSSCGCVSIIKEAITEYSEKHAYMTKYNDTLTHYNRVNYMVTHFSHVLSNQELVNALHAYHEYFGGHEVYISIFADGPKKITIPEEFKYPDHMHFFFGYCNGEFIGSSDYQTHIGLPQHIFMQMESHAYLIHPLVHGDETYGYVVVDHVTASRMSFTIYRNNLNLAFNRIASHKKLNLYAKKLEEQALKDPLTGVYNRRGLEN